MLPKDCLGSIFLHLSVREVARNSLLCRTTAALYRDDAFWQRYCRVRYLVDVRAPDFYRKPGETALATAVEADSFVRILWQQRAYPVAHVLPRYFSLPPKRRVECLERLAKSDYGPAHVPNLVASAWCALSDSRQAPNLDLVACSAEDCERFTLGYGPNVRPSVAQNLGRIFKAVRRSTVYLTERGPVVLPLDIDLCVGITPQIQALHSEEFRSLAREQLWILMHHTCLQYLPERSEGDVQ